MFISINYQTFFCHNQWCCMGCATPTHAVLQPLKISFWILYNAGWCHSVLLFMIGTGHLLIRTASLTCLVRQSLDLPVTLAVKLPATPWCSFLWCFNMNELLFLVLYLSLCSLLLVNKFLEVSPKYKLRLSAGHIWHSGKSFPEINVKS